MSVGRRRLEWAAIVVLILSQPAGAVTTKFWTVETQAEMAEGELEGVSITSEGRLILAPGRDLVLDWGDMYVWALGKNAKGDLFAATGEEGIIYRIPKKGDPEIFFDSLEMEILSLVVGGDGSVYAGASPDGMIFKVSPNGEAETFFDSPEDYVWDLAFDGKGNLYAATGDEGRIYRVTPGGKATIFYDSPETHIMCLLPDGEGGFYAGSEGNGILYHLDESGNASVVYDAEEPEVSAVAMDGAGNLFFAAVEGIEGDSGEETSENGGSGSGRARIFRVSPSGVVSQYWRVPSDFVFDLALGTGGRLLVATGGKGELYALGAHEEWWKIVGLDEVQILDILVDTDGVFLGTGNVGRVYRLGEGYTREGTFTTKPFAAQTISRWGTLDWEGQLPEGCSVAFSMRTGNTEKPDETWSDWSGESRNPAAFKVADARFAQWRVRLTSGGEETPAVESVTVAYLERNLPPELKLLRVLPAGETFYEGIPDAGPAPVTQVFPGGIRIQYSVSGMGVPPVPEEELGWVRSIRTARWQAFDPNEDVLQFEIGFRAEGEDHWKTLEKEWKDPVYSWESLRMPDGRYRIRVVAEDTPDNPADLALQDELVSDPFEIDNTSPQIVDLKARRVDDGVEVTGRVRDAMSPLRKGRYSIDAGRWVPFLPGDGLFDSQEETIRFLAPSKESSEQTILIQVVDAAGNPGVATVNVREKKP